MNSKKAGWTIGLAVLVAVGCSKNPAAPKSAATASSQGNSPHAGYSAEAPEYLEQGWSHDVRMEWWYTSQGSRIIPYDWFLALEQADSEELFRSKDNLEERLRFIGGPTDAKWNPDGLPIGFVADKAENGTRYFGVNCAACHTGQFEYQAKTVVTEGGPALSDFDGLVAGLAQTLQVTLDDDKKFARFASRVLGENTDAASVASWKDEVKQATGLLAERVKVNHAPYPSGYGRLDAFGNIFNEGSVFSINEPSNAKPSNAPVSYPVVWDAAQHDILQWNGSAVNAGIGSYVRNTGEVVGVFGDLVVSEVTVAGKKKLRYEHHIDVKALARLEVILTTLWSPTWPETALPAIDKAKAALGKPLYDKGCVSCHQDINRTDPSRRIAAKMIPVTQVGTDPLMASNPATSVSKTGIMEGQLMLPITQYLPNLGIIDVFGPQAPTSKVVGNGILGVLREELGMIKFAAGLSDYVNAAKRNALFENCDPKVEGAKCIRPPRYKARPLNGIWASAPFLHNGSVPNLAELLKKPEQRVATFSVGRWEFDPINVGYSTEGGPNTSLFDTSQPNNSNRGHDYGTSLSDAEKAELIEYIKTL
jgi:mono/diheme cytochrome c family protein